MEWLLYRRCLDSCTKTGDPISKLRCPLVAILICGLILNLVLYHFFVISQRQFISQTHKNRTLDNIFFAKASSRFAESNDQTVAETIRLLIDKFDVNLKEVLDDMNNVTKDLDEIKLTIKELNKRSNTTGNLMKRKDRANRSFKSTSLLTLFSTWTKSKEKYTIHNNTLKNWSSFKPAVNPVLFTNDSALAQDAEGYGWTVLPLTKTADNGLPVLKDMYIDSQKNFDSMFYCFANSDILFDDGLVQTLVQIVFTLGNNTLTSTPVILTGLRWNVISVLGNETSPREHLKALQKRRGKVFGTSAEDYFITNWIYPWHDIPEVVVGSIAYDNWLVLNAREKKHLTINTSRTILALHQSLDGNNHRSHVRDTVNYNGDLLMDKYKINLPYHKGFVDCIEKFTDIVNDTFVLGDRMVSQYCN